MLCTYTTGNKKDGKTPRRRILSHTLRSALCCWAHLLSTTNPRARLSPLSPSDGERDGARGHPTPVHGVGRSPSPHPMEWAGVRGRLLAFSRYGCFVCIRVKQNAIRFFMTEEHVPSMGSAQIQPAIVRAVPQWNSHARGAKL